MSPRRTLKGLRTKERAHQIVRSLGPACVRRVKYTRRAYRPASRYAERVRPAYRRVVRPRSRPASSRAEAGGGRVLLRQHPGRARSGRERPSDASARQLQDHVGALRNVRLPRHDDIVMLAAHRLPRRERQRRSRGERVADLRACTRRPVCRRGDRLPHAGSAAEAVVRARCREAARKFYARAAGPDRPPPVRRTGAADCQEAHAAGSSADPGRSVPALSEPVLSMPNDRAARPPARRLGDALRQRDGMHVRAGIGCDRVV